MSDIPVDEYHVGWICALPEELTAALSMLDQEYPRFEGQEHQDNNSYVLGRIQGHNMAIACMPAGVDGPVSAATVARDMARTFPALRVCLMVGIGGGIPDLAKGVDIRLGDVVISEPHGTSPGVIQYDKGKSEEGFIIKGHLNQPPQILLDALSLMRAKHDMRDSLITEYMSTALERHPKMKKSGYCLPESLDCYFCVECNQDTARPGDNCTQAHSREKLTDTNPVIHYGIIASGNTVVKNADVRDDLRARFNAMCVEMEAAGLMNHFPCLVLRGICDYADAHKNDGWHRYAAMTAAACAKELLSYVSPTKTANEKPIRQLIDVLNGMQQTSLDGLKISKEQLEINKEQFRQTQTQYESNRHAQCHQVFKTSPYEEFKDINPDRTEGTCQWVLSHPKYLEWSSSERDDLLWISADPGCGKSVLARSLVDYELCNTDTHYVCYFFFKDNEQQDSISTAFCALLHQIFSHRPHLIRHAVPAWEKAGNNITEDVSELWRIWLAVAADCVKHSSVTCVFDALDECRDTERRKLIRLLTDFYTKSVAQSIGSQTRLKILVTSRPYDDISRGFNAIPSHLPTIHLSGENENDQISKEIDLVVHARVQQLAVDLKLVSDVTQRILTRLLEIEHRTYLWLHLAIEDIYHTFRKSLRRNQQSINFIPSSVEQAYEKILGKIGKEDEPIARQILQIIVAARRPLTIAEIAIALGIATANECDSYRLATIQVDQEHLGNRIRDLCRLFIFINHSRIYLIHQTAKEFLVRESQISSATTAWGHSVNLMEAEIEMARICVEFICLTEVKLLFRTLILKWENRTLEKSGWYHVPMEDVGDVSNEAETFAIYSATFWHQHVREARLYSENALTQRIHQLYDTSSEIFRLWFQVYWETIRPGICMPQVNELHLAAILGHDQKLSLILHRNDCPNIDALDSRERTALCYASERNYLSSVKLLLRYGAAIMVKEENVNALVQASQLNSLELVHLLLAWSADSEVQSKPYYLRALVSAVTMGHFEIAKLLSEGADVNLRPEKDEWNALEAAAYSGHLEIVKLLLANGANVNVRAQKSSANALEVASTFGYIEIVRLLLANGADTNLKPEEGTTNALRKACTQGHCAIVKLLLDSGASINAKSGKDAGFALGSASLGHDIELVNILLERGADINATDVYAHTALHNASYNGNAEVITLLLDRGADINAINRAGDTALHHASHKRKIEAVKLLIERGADVNAKGENGTPLHIARKKRYFEIERLLIDAGAVDDASSDGSSEDCSDVYSVRSEHLSQEDDSDLEDDGESDWEDDGESD